jgi:hypothetical protein
MVYLSFATFSHLTQEQRNLGFPAPNQTRQDFAATLYPHAECCGCALPIAPVGAHADGAALEVA